MEQNVFQQIARYPPGEPLIRPLFAPVVIDGSSFLDPLFESGRLGSPKRRFLPVSDIAFHLLQIFT